MRLRREGGRRRAERPVRVTVRAGPGCPRPGCAAGFARRGGLVVDRERFQRLQPDPADHARRVHQARRRDAERVLHRLRPARDERHAPAVGDQGLAGVVERRGTPDVQPATAVRRDCAAEDNGDQVGRDSVGVPVVPQQPPGEPPAGEDTLMNVLPERQRLIFVRSDVAQRRGQPVEQGTAVDAHCRPPVPGRVEEVGDITRPLVLAEREVQEEQPVPARRGRDRRGDPAHAYPRLVVREPKPGRVNLHRIGYPRQQAAGRRDVVREPAHVEPVAERVH
jgi:hypothetical protein